MNQPFVKIDLHGLRQEEAIRIIDKAIKEAGPSAYQLQLIHGYHRGTNLRSMIYDWYESDPKVLRVIPGDNPDHIADIKRIVLTADGWRNDDGERPVSIVNRDDQ